MPSKPAGGCDAKIYSPHLERLGRQTRQPGPQHPRWCAGGGGHQGSRPRHGWRRFVDRPYAAEGRVRQGVCAGQCSVSSSSSLCSVVSTYISYIFLVRFLLGLLAGHHVHRDHVRSSKILGRCPWKYRSKYPRYVYDNDVQENWVETTGVDCCAAVRAGSQVYMYTHPAVCRGWYADGCMGIAACAVFDRRLAHQFAVK